MAELKAQTSAAGYAMSQQGRANSLRSYYGALLENPNVQRGLATIKATEGTAQKADPYSTAFGGGTLSNITDHPGISYGFKETTGKKNRTTAAGAYQFLSRTWKSVSKKLGLTDFGPLSQDIAALGLIDQAGGLAALVAGDVKGFVSKVNGVWASLPGAPYAQPTKAWGFVEDAWNNALNPNKDQLPGTAPTPYSRDAQQSFADARPDNQNYAGPKGIFSVDTSRAPPIGHVARSPLGPATPSGFSGMGTPRGMGSISARSLGPAAPSVSKSASSPSRPDTLGGVHMSSPVGMGGPGGNYVDAASAAQATAANHAAASAARQAAVRAPAAPSAPAASAPSRPDMLGGVSYSSPKGVFSVDPGAKVQASIAPSPLGPAAPKVGLAAPASVAPARPPAAIPVAPVPAAAVPKPAVVAAPVTPSYSRQAVAPARPALSAADVYGGSIGTAQTSTPGTTVSRATSYGPTYTSNKFGAVTATAADGTQMAAWGGVPSKPAIAGPLGQTGIATQAAPTGGMFGPKAKAATGVVTGAALGGFALGPLGAALGGLIGKNMAQGKAPLSGILGGKSATNPGTRTVDTYAGKMTFSNPVGGLGFPSAPAAPKGAYTGPRGGSGGLSPQARDALGKNNGLY